jgi:hypothetical protein
LWHTQYSISQPDNVQGDETTGQIRDRHDPIVVKLGAVGTLGVVQDWVKSHSTALLLLESVYLDLYF